LLLGLAPPIGEWLWVNHLTSHHGYPVTFGVISGIMILTGIMLLLRLLRSYQAARDDFQADGG
jgi:nitrate reductase gamma subunit